MTIAIDAMGGDYYPQVPVEAAVKAVNEKNIPVILVGDEARIKQELQGKRYDASKLNIHHASQVVEMDENVVSAMKNKKDSSMRVCYDLHKQGLAKGVVSAGSSGAMLAIGRFVLKTLPGIDRPAISALLPSQKNLILLVDSGANTDSTPNNLLQFGILGSLYMEHIHNRSNPTVALLNIGGEEGKGDELAKAAYELLKKSPLNFIGNVEGKEFFDGHCDVIVCDGFAGNVLLKSVQGTAKFIIKMIKDEIAKSTRNKMGALMMKPVFDTLKQRISYENYNGAPLLGLKGNGIVCHGSSSPEAMLFGIGFAQWAAEANLVERMMEHIQPFQDILKESN